MKNYHVLLIENEPEIRRTLSDSLEAEGFRLFVTRSIAEAFQTIQIQPIHIAIVRFHLPDGNAFDFVSRCKSIDPSIACFVLDESSIPGASSSTVLQHLDGYWIKPTQFGELAGRIEDDSFGFGPRESLNDLLELFDILSKYSPGVVYRRHSENPEGFSFVSANVEKIIGYSAAQFVSGEVTWADLVHPDDASSPVEGVGAGDDQKILEYRIKNIDGQWLWVRDHIRQIRSKSGFPVEVVGVLIDISFQRETERELTLYFQAAEKSGEALIIMDSQRLITHVNNAALSIFGYTHSEFINSSIIFLCGSQTDTKVIRHLTETLRSGDSWQGRLVGRRKDKSTFPAYATITPVQATPRQKNFVVLIRDISDKEAAQRLVKTVRGEYQHLLGHELNNLLTPVIGMAQLLSKSLEASESSFLAETARMVYETANRAVSFVEKLRQMNSIELGTRALCLRRGDINMLTESVIEELRPFAEPDGVRVIFARCREECIADFDYDLMPRVVENLVRNAIEHVCEEDDSEQKTVTVTTSTDGNKVTFSIHNYGRAIPQEKLCMFFEAFYTDRTRKTRGTGLGTTYARLVVEAHGGSISVSSDLMNGTRVWFEIPFKKAEEKGV